MGCDIHCYIEHRVPGENSFSGLGGYINPGRNYNLFGHLAGVRLDYPPVVEPRGIPDRDTLSYEAKGDYWLYVCDSDDEGCTSHKNAERYVSSYGKKGVYDSDGKLKFVEHPDWHTPGWVTAAELEEALSRSEARWGEAKYRAVIAAMKSFEAAGHEARLVFWFDN